MQGQRLFLPALLLLKHGQGTKFLPPSGLEFNYERCSNRISRENGGRQSAEGNFKGHAA
jgi:hypothetical protein